MGQSEEGERSVNGKATSRRSEIKKARVLPLQAASPKDLRIPEEDWPQVFHLWALHESGWDGFVLSTQSHLDLALRYLEDAAVEFVGAKQSGEFFKAPTYYLERMDLLKRATVNLKEKMLKDAVDTGQEELRF